MKTKRPNTIGILMLGGAKRVSMAMHLSQAAMSLGLQARLYSYELSALVPISSVATIIKGYRWNDPDIFADLHRIINEEAIDVMIPFVDGAVEIAARYPFADCYSPTCDASLAGMMFDKVLASQIFERERIDIPRTYTRGAPQFPLIAKPRNGSASRGLKVIRSTADFRSVDTSQYLIQEYVESSREFTVDCFVSRSGEIIATVPRERLETAGGEVTRTITVDRDDIIGTSRDILSRLGFKGAVTLQFIQDTRTNKVLLMEINPRLGGGAVCSVAAGANLPLFILKEAVGEPVTPVTDWKPGTLVARYLQETVFNLE